MVTDPIVLSLAQVAAQESRATRFARTINSGNATRLRQRRRAAGLPVIDAAGGRCTAELAVLRLHGHNAETWEKPNITAAERFRYLYSEDVLRGGVGPARALAEQGDSLNAGRSHRAATS
jgi:hypothetical protein